jgi:hypothetical protein
LGAIETATPEGGQVDDPEDLPVGEPGELGGEDVALAHGRRNRHCKAVVDVAREPALEPAEIDISDHAFAGWPITEATGAMPPGTCR